MSSEPLASAAPLTARRPLHTITSVLAMVAAGAIGGMTLLLGVLAGADGTTTEFVTNWGLHLGSLALLAVGLILIAAHLYQQRGEASGGEQVRLVTAQVLVVVVPLLAVPLAFAWPLLYPTSSDMDTDIAVAYGVAAAGTVLAVIVYTIGLVRVPAANRARVARLGLALGGCGWGLVCLVLSTLLIPWPVPCCPF